MFVLLMIQLDIHKVTDGSIASASCDAKSVTGINNAFGYQRGKLCRKGMYFAVRGLNRFRYIRKNIALYYLTQVFISVSLRFVSKD